jgi:uncharacterized lipoprotein YddW (UPF0748 family)
VSSQVTETVEAYRVDACWMDAHRVAGWPVDACDPLGAT